MPRLPAPLLAFWNGSKALLFGPPSIDAPSARARALIEEAQDRAEVTITLVQLGAVAAFAAIYAITPKAFPEDAPFEPVPVTLAIYAAFSGVRLILALRRALPGWFLSLSVVVDVAVLMVTIWSFHLQYQMAPAFYLKAPTVMYVFILIALRALRFDPFYVVLTGLASAIGWLALLVYAIAYDPSMSITRSFAEYVHGPRILIGAEMDKIISILLVTVVLAIAIVRAKRYLGRAVAEGQAAQALSRFFDPEVAGEIAAGDVALTPGVAARRRAAIMVVDMRGFTRLTRELDPAISMALLAEYQAMVAEVVRAHGGAIDKYMGDGVLASFGAINAVEDVAARGVQALEALTVASAAWRERRRANGLPAPDVGASLAIGDVMVGVVGALDRLEHTVIGDAVNLAAKLEKHNKVEGAAAVATDAALEAARREGHRPRDGWIRLEGRVVDGLDSPQVLHVLQSEVIHAEDASHPVSLRPLGQ